MVSNINMMLDLGYFILCFNRYFYELQNMLALISMFVAVILVVLCIIYFCPLFETYFQYQLNLNRACLHIYNLQPENPTHTSNLCSDTTKLIVGMWLNKVT